MGEVLSSSNTKFIFSAKQGPIWGRPGVVTMHKTIFWQYRGALVFNTLSPTRLLARSQREILNGRYHMFLPILPFPILGLPNDFLAG